MRHVQPHLTQLPHTSHVQAVFTTSNLACAVVQDIDNYKIEAALMAALLDDPDTLALIDEFYHEDHVNFSEMMDWWDWNKQYDPHRSLADSYQQFLKLRQLGIRAHPWV